MTARLLDKPSAAEYLGITVRHLELLHQRRELAAVRVGRLLRFDRGDLDTYIKNNRTVAS